MAAKCDIKKGPFEATWESLRKFECPDWFRDAKFGIWSHWGPQCVPMYGDWYARHMYVEGHDQYKHHWRHYGHPSKFGYKDLCKLWKAERFDPDGLMDLYVKAGAKYFVGQAMHHDNFDNFDSAHNPWNSVKVGPKRNICRMWQDAAKKRGLPFGLTEHLGASFSWSSSNKGADKEGPYAGVPYDGNDPEFETLYYPNADENRDEYRKKNIWYTENEWFHKHWLDRIVDVIDKHQPDLLYSDGGVPFMDYGLTAIAHLYNTSAALHDGNNVAVYNQKDRKEEVHSIGVLDIERGGQADIFPTPWQIDTCVGGWFYDVRQRYKTPQHVIEMLIDIVSKNGNLLLNLPQRPDGTLDEECLHILKCLGEWMPANGEGLFGTRPWHKAEEGDARRVTEGFKESATEWTCSDFRFTSKGNTVYAFMMKWPENGKVTVKTLASDAVATIRDTVLLGLDGRVEWRQDSHGLDVTLPDKPLSEFPACLRVELEG